jgi:hypothetical protein
LVLEISFKSAGFNVSVVKEEPSSGSIGGGDPLPFVP